MAASTGTTRGGAPFGAAAALAVVVGGAGAVLGPVRDVADGLWLLLGWLLPAGAAVWGAELAVVRAGRTRTSSDANEPRTLRLDTTGILATALAAELTLITARLARGHEYGIAWASGGVLLALFAAFTLRTAVISRDHGSGHTPSDDLPSCAAFVLSGASGGWLTVRFAVQGPLWAAWALGCATVVLAGGFWLSDSQSWSVVSRYQKVVAAAAVLGVAGVVAELAVRGETVAAWWVGGVAVGGLLVAGAVVGFLVLAPEWSWGEHARGRTAPLGAQLAGTLVPLASLAWAAWDETSWSGRGSGDGRLLGVSYLVGAAAALLVVQSAVLAWTGTGPPVLWVGRLVDSVRRLAELGSGPPEPPPWGNRGYDPSNDRRQRERERDYRRWEESRGRHLSIFDDLTENDDGVYAFSDHLTHPLQSSAVLAVHRRTALATGLAIDEIWPRIELVAPEQVKARVRRGERGVLARRITVASAVCTAGVWLFIALNHLGGFRLEGGSPALLVVGPLLVAAVALVQARRLLVEVYAAKADAVEVYRYDLAQSLRLDPPEDPAGMIRLAAELSGDQNPLRHLDPRSPDEDPASYSSSYPPGRRPSQLPTKDPGLLTGARLDRLTAELAEQLRRDVRTDVRQAVRDEYATLARQNPARATLPELDLAQLAREIADRAAEPVSTHLKGHLTELQQKFQQDVRAEIRSSLEESVTGPPLTNFVGYLAIELDRSAQGDEQPPVRAEGGTIKAPAGRRVNLVVSVVRDPRAQNLPAVLASRPGREFFVFEPVRVEGGRDAPSVSFDAMADSSTLTPLPQRKNLLVTDEQQTSFGFQLPEAEGSHEVWFQLYQAGHLVQVVALKVEAEPAPAAPEPDEA